MSRPVTVWDLPTRIIHWVIAFAVLANLFVIDGDESVHHWVGYGALLFVGFRGVWGFVGGKHSRFANFPIRPKQIMTFLRNPLSKSLPDYPGHNPAGSLVYFCLWSCVIALAASGWMLGLDSYFGEDWLEETHEAIALVVQVLLVLHFLGIAIDTLKFKRKTWLGMILGRRS